MENYINKIIETSQKLNNTGFKIDDNWVGSMLLADLPEHFSPMIMGIEHSEIKIMTDAIKTKLLDDIPHISVKQGALLPAAVLKEKLVALISPIQLSKRLRTSSATNVNNMATIKISVQIKRKIRTWTKARQDKASNMLSAQYF
jgi:hypothetical protein